MVSTLGCPRNLVDSEVMMGALSSQGHEIVRCPEEAEVIICNTCAFIEEASQESVDHILELAACKEGRCRLLLVSGCLSQRYGHRLLEELPEVDGVVGTGEFHEIAELLERVLKGERICVVGGPTYLYNHLTPRLFSTPAHYAYLKIAEGCDKLCSYCVIPGLRGDYRSRDFNSIVEEARSLAQKGVKELIVIAQDTTSYGIDLYGRPRTAELLGAISEIDGIRWIRLLYTHPQSYTDELIGTIAREEKVCNYLDLPIQHISDSILRAMNRNLTRRKIEALIQRLRSSIPGLTLRTSLIVGFPGEGEEEFEELIQFLEETKFERLGVFRYSREEGTEAAELDGQVPEKVKSERYDRVMELGRQISYERNRSLVGRTLVMLIDGRLSEGDFQFRGRTSADAPEIDCSVLLKGENINIGDFVEAKIVNSDDYDLFGEVA